MTRSVVFKIETQGAVVINNGYVRAKNKDMAALEFDMRSKYAEMILYHSDDAGRPSIMMQAGEDTLHLDTTKPRDMPTVITIQGFKGWDVYMAECSRYTLRVVLIRKCD